MSDFLGDGGANVEARAKSIFQTLEAQEGTVILFDEIDSFLLDRDSKLYRKQDSLFQFLTPGMLTKINDLRKCQRSIFIIATNYANRIDAAIKRAGRIDRQYMLALPNANRRIEILKANGFEAVDQNKQLLIEETVFFGYSDLKGAATGAKKTLQDLLGELKIRSPSIYLDSYYATLLRGEKFPTVEFISALELAKEADGMALISKFSGNLRPKDQDELKKNCDEAQLTKLASLGIQL